MGDTIARLGRCPTPRRRRIRVVGSLKSLVQISEMADLVWAVLCQRVIADQESNLVSYIDCIEELVAKKLPAAAPRFIVGTLWARQSEAEVLHLRVRVTDPQGNETLNFEPGPMAMTHLRHRVNVQIGSFPVETTGLHSVYIERKTEGGWTTDRVLPLIFKQQLPGGAPISA